MSAQAPLADRIAKKIINSKSFQADCEAFVRRYASSVLPPTANPTELPDLGNAPQRLLLSASALALSTLDHAREYAAQIAIMSLQERDASEQQRVSAAHVLRRLANMPAVQLAHRRELLSQELEDRLPLSLRFEQQSLRLRQVVVTGTGEELPVNRFQGELWHALQTHQWVGVSAPTSAGKSYVLNRWVESVLATSDERLDLVYIVPTRALIGQVEKELSRKLSEAEVANAVVLSMPALVLAPNKFSRVFVMTQERVLRLLGMAGPRVNPALVMVDEAQKLGDGTRGILLHQVIQKLSDRNANCQVVLASALASNPEALVEDAPDPDDSTSLRAIEPNVVQNLFWVSQVERRPRRWTVEHLWGGRPAKVGEISLSHSPNGTRKRLAFLAHALGKDTGGSIVYVNRAADAEEIAKLLSELLAEEVDLRADPDIRSLIDLSSIAVHPKYSLASVARHGVAFHYGAMPTIVRQEIERLFTVGKLKFLVCTSTLLEGVNLPCRNIFVRDPKKGIGKPMKPADFWNLAGRAGRWGREFEGNIYCIDANDPDAWPSGVPSQRTTYTLRSAAKEGLSDIDKFVDYLQRGAPSQEAEDSAEQEHVASYLTCVVAASGGLHEARWLGFLPKDDRARIGAELDSFIDRLKVPLDVVARNPGISPGAIDRLYLWMRRHDDLGALMPPTPESRRAVSEMDHTFEVLNRFFGEAFGPDKRRFMLAITVVYWMRGWTVARIIDERLKNTGSRRSNVPTEIRGVMDDVNSFARFKAPKYLTCYVDVLRSLLESRGDKELLQELPDFEELLEYGLAQKTQLSLAALGLSRTSTVLISQSIARDDLTPRQVLDWLSALDLGAAPYTQAILREIRDALERGSVLRAYYT